MSVLPILVYGDPRLRRASSPVGGRDHTLHRLIQDMIETMYAAPGRGLAAPQVGVNLRLFVIDAFWKDTGNRVPRVFLNPRCIKASADRETREEGCLSIPGVPALIDRPAVVHFAWEDLDGRQRHGEFSGLEATCLQHELDHLDGILIDDRVARARRREMAEPLAALAQGQRAA